MNIISASRRTDIPSFYPEWFLNRISAGYVTTINPYNGDTRRVSLLPEDVSGFVFWTRDFYPLRQNWAPLEDYKYGILWTINNYPGYIEPTRENVIRTFMDTSRFIGDRRIVWRYDPIIITDMLTPEWHKKNFEIIAKMLAGFTHKVIISFMHPYKNVTKYYRDKGIHFKVKPLETEGIDDMLLFMVDCAKKYGMALQACGMSGKLTKYDIPDKPCLSPAWLESIGIQSIYGKDKGQRKACLCTQSIDIGTYNTCIRGCTYCYATKDKKRAKEFYKRHNYRAEHLKPW